MSADEIVLTIPREEGFAHVAQLVLGGVAARLNLTYENLDDLELAVESLLERADATGDVVVALRVDADAIRTAVGPFRGDSLRRELERGIDDDVGLRRVLETVVDSFELGQREDGLWVELTKNVRTVATGS